MSHGNMTGGHGTRSPSRPSFYKNKEGRGPWGWGSLSGFVQPPGLLAALISSLTLGSVSSDQHRAQSQGSVCSFLTTKHFSSVQNPIKTSYDLHLAFLGWFHGNAFLESKNTPGQLPPNVSPTESPVPLLGRHSFRSDLPLSSRTCCFPHSVAWSGGVGTKDLTVGEAI